MRHPSDLLQSAFMGDVTTLRQLVLFAGMSHEEAAKLCMVSPATFRRWLSDRKPNPTAVKLLAVLCGYVPWEGWEDWEVHNGYFFPPGYDRNGIAPGDILAIPFQRQLLSEYRRLAAKTEIALSEPAKVHSIFEKSSGQ